MSIPFNISTDHPPYIDSPLSDLDTWGRGHLGTCLFCPFFGHFKHVPMCPKLQYNLLSFVLMFFLFSHPFSLPRFSQLSQNSLLNRGFLRALLLLRFSCFAHYIDSHLSNLDTWGRVYFVHFLDILNTSPSVQIGNVVLDVALYRHKKRPTSRLREYHVFRDVGLRPLSTSVSRASLLFVYTPYAPSAKHFGFPL